MKDVGKKKTKPYPAVMRAKHRYIYFEVISGKKHDEKAVINELWRAVLDTLGSAGAAGAGFRLISFENVSQKGILRCDAKKLYEVRAAVTLLHEIEGAPTFVHALNISGTLRKLK